MSYAFRFRSMRFRTAVALCFAVTLALHVFSGVARAETPNLPAAVQKSINSLLALRKGGTPDKAALAAFLDFATSPLVLRGTDDKPPVPAPHQSATGVFWRSRMNVSLKTLLQYLYNPDVAAAFVYPASVRYANWNPGSGILSLDAPLWEQLGKHKDAPLILRGSEVEEISPDTFSGVYYRYTIDRMLILTEYEGKHVLVSLSWQRGNSDSGRKAAHIGPYDNWDFVYSNAKGTLVKGIGWADTYIYSSMSLVAFYETAPGSNTVACSMFRWLNAGWSGMNMVKPHHIATGAKRSFDGLNAFLDAPKRPSPAELSAYTASLKALDVPALQKKLAPYSAKVEEAAASNEVLKTEDFQQLIKNGGYGASMNKDQLISVLCVNYIKQKLGMPLLAGPLN